MVHISPLEIEFLEVIGSSCKFCSLASSFYLCTCLTRQAFHPSRRCDNHACLIAVPGIRLFLCLRKRVKVFSHSNIPSLLKLYSFLISKFLYSMFICSQFSPPQTKAKQESYAPEEAYLLLITTSQPFLLPQFVLEYPVFPETPREFLIIVCDQPSDDFPI